jgi:hypothetical protein
MGRPRKYKDAAEKQAAYNQRLKEQEELERQKSINESDLLELDILEFFERVVGSKPNTKQTELLLSLEKPDIHQYAICSARQCGKSLSIGIWAIFRSLHYPDQTILLSSAQESWIYDHISKAFTRNKELQKFIAWEGRKGVIPLTGFETIFHSRVLLRGCTEKALRGVPADIVILDEVALMDDDTIGTAQGNLSGKVYKFILLSTPPRIDLSGKFQKVVLNPKKFKFILFNWSKFDCEWHSKEELENNKLNLSTEEYLTEVLGKPLRQEQKGIFDPKHLKKCTHPTVLSEGGKTESGIDSGGTGERDKYALIIVERVQTRVKVRLVKWWNFENIDETPEAVRDVLIQYNTTINKMDSQPEEFYQDLQAISKKKIYPMIMKQYREEMLGHLKYLIKTHKLEIEETEEELLKQLYRFTKKAGHDDCLVWALALACYENKELFKPENRCGAVAVCDTKTGEIWTNQPVTREHLKPDHKEEYAAMLEAKRKREEAKERRLDAIERAKITRKYSDRKVSKKAKVPTPDKPEDGTQ